MRVSTQNTGRYGVVLNPGTDDEELAARFHFYPAALDACREYLAHGDDADVVRVDSDGTVTTEY